MTTLPAKSQTLSIGAYLLEWRQTSVKKLPMQTVSRARGRTPQRALPHMVLWSHTAPGDAA